MASQIPQTPTLPCLSCAGLLFLLWPMPFLVLGVFLFRSLPEGLVDSGTFAGYILFTVILILFIVACVVPGFFVARRLLRNVCSKEARARLEERGFGSFQRALDWWSQGWRPTLLLVTMIFLNGMADALFLDAGVDAFTAFLGVDLLKSAVFWLFKWLFFLAAGLCAVALTCPFMKAPAD